MPPQDPQPDQILASGVYFAEADSVGQLNQANPTIQFAEPAQGDVMVTYLFAQPQPVSDLRLTLVGPEGSEVFITPLNLWGRWTANHDDYVAYRNIPPAPYGTGLINLYRGNSLRNLSPIGVNLHEKTYGVANDGPLSLRRLFTGRQFTFNNTSLNTGPAVVHGITMRLRGMVLDWKRVSGRGVQVRLEQNGAPIATKTVLVVPYRGSETMEGEAEVHENGLFANIMSGDYGFQLPIFDSNGPGFPVSLLLTYRASSSAYWRSVATLPELDQVVYAPFGHGWGCLFTMRLLKRQWERRVSFSPNLKEDVTTYYFQDSDGRITELYDNALTQPDSWAWQYTANQYLFSSGLQQPFAKLMVRRFGSGYEIVGEACPLIVRFDQEGRLVEIKRTDNKRSLKLQHDADAITITDACGRQTVLELNDGMVKSIIEPGGLARWELEYVDHNLMTIKNADYQHRFDYDNDSFQLSKITEPNRIETQLRQLGTGAGNRLYSHTFSGFVRNGASYQFVFSPVGTNENEYDLTITDPMQQMVTHAFRVPASAATAPWTVTKAGQSEKLYVDRGVGFIYATEDAHGNRWQHIRDQYGRLVGQNWPGAGREYMRYDAQNPKRLIEHVKRAGGRTAFTYVDLPEAEDLVSTVAYPEASPGALPAVELFDYDSFGNLRRHSNPIGTTTEYERSTQNGQLGLVTKKTLRGANGETLVETFDYDALGRVIRQTIDNNKETLYRYNELGLQIYTKKPDGVVERHEYDMNTGLVTRCYDSGGAEATYTYGADGLRETEAIKDGGTVRYKYDALGRIIQTVEQNDQRTLKVDLTYHENGEVEARHENNVLVSSFVYDAVGNVIETRNINNDDGSEQITKMTYSKRNLVKAIEYPAVNGFVPSAEIEFTVDDLVEKVTLEVEPGKEQVTEYEYDGRRRQTKIKKMFPPDEYIEESAAYDAAGNLIMRRGPNFNWLGGTVLRNAVRTHNNRARQRQKLERDGLGRVISVLNTAETETIAATNYTATGLMRSLQVPGENGAITVDEAQYHTNTGRLSTLKNQYGQSTVVEYDAAGRPNKATDPLGTVTSVLYDSLDRPIETLVELASGARHKVETRYYANGLTMEMVLIAGGNRQVTHYDYDDHGRMTRIINPLGKETLFTYDGYGRLATRTDPNGTVATYSYNELGHINEVNYSSGEKIRRKTDAMGRLLVVEDDQFRKEIQRDVQGRKIGVHLTDATAGVTKSLSYAYDTFGKIATVTDTENLATYYSYDSDDRLRAVHQGPVNGPRERKGVYHYDAGNRISRVDHYPGLFQSNYSYDEGGAAERIVNRLPSLGSLSEVLYGRDDGGRVTSKRFVHLGITAHYRYDGFGQLIYERITDDQSGDLSERNLIYDEAGNCTVSVLNGMQTQHEYNLFNQLIRSIETEVSPLVQGVSATADSALDSQHYADLANDQQINSDTDPGNAFVSETTDVDHWLELKLAQPLMIGGIKLDIPANHGIPKKLALYYFDAQDNAYKPVVISFVSHAEKAAPSGSGAGGEFIPRGTAMVVAVTPFTTDKLRLTQARGDAPINPASQLDNALAVNELTILQVSTKIIDFTYDDNGNLIAEGPRTYQYDMENRLTRIVDPGVHDLELVYGPDGSLLREIDHIGSISRSHFYKGAEIYASYDQNGRLVRKNIPGHKLDYKLGYIDSTDNTNYLIWEAMGSTNQVIEDANALLETRLEDAWGNSLYDSIGQNLTAPSQYQTEYGYAGRRLLGSTGLMDFRGRVYHPGLKRFLTPDPSGARDGENRYLYVHNDPVNNRDPYGFQNQGSVTWAFVKGFGEGALIGLKALVNAVPETVSFGFYEADIIEPPSNPEDRRIYGYAQIPARITTEVAFAAATIGVSAAAKTAQAGTQGSRALRSAAILLIAGESSQAASAGYKGLREMIKGNYGSGTFHLTVALLGLIGAGGGLKAIARRKATPSFNIGEQSLNPFHRPSVQKALKNREIMYYDNMGDVSGLTDGMGRILINSKLEGRVLLETVRHELTHRMLRPTRGPMWWRRMIGGSRQFLFRNSQLFKAFEEALAFGRGQENFRGAFRDIFGRATDRGVISKSMVRAVYGLDLGRIWAEFFAVGSAGLVLGANVVASLIEDD